MSQNLFEDDASQNHGGQPGDPVATWPCPKCDYINLAEAGECQRCGASREPAADASKEPATTSTAPFDGDATVTGASALPAVTQPSLRRTRAPREPRPARTGGRAIWIALVVILLALGGLGYVGYCAWTYGYFDDYLPKRWRAATEPVPEAVALSDAGVDLSQAVALSGPEIVHPLKELSESKEPKLRALKRYVEPLLAAEDAMDRVSITNAGEGVLSTDTLTQLTTLDLDGQTLLDEYVKFEAQAKEMTADVQAPYVTLVRQQFEADFLRLIKLVGQAYALDLDGSHPVYELHVKVPWTLKDYGQIDPQQYDDAWIAAIKERKQTELDIRNKDVYQAIAVRQEALKVLHSAFGEAMRAVPDYASRQGVLDTNGHQLLKLLDNYEDKLEDMYAEYEEFRAKLKFDEEPRKFAQYCDDYLYSLQQDHLFCFTEIYRVYVDDKELDDPVYTKNLDVHFPFVKKSWPKLEFDYRKVAAQYEDEWARRWRGHGTGGPQSSEPEPPPEGASDEIPWVK